jgi:hypothetical protein
MNLDRYVDPCLIIIVRIQILTPIMYAGQDPA